MAITLAQAQAKLTEYMTAESKVLAGQSYSIGDRALTRADLEEIRKGLEYWEKKVSMLAAGRTQPPVRQIVPRD
jgi:hypothetical protein